jgi:hypothetical protein
MRDEREEWLAKRAAAAPGPDGPVVDTCVASPRPDGRVDLVLRGRNLDPHAIPPDIRVGDHRLIELRVDRDGGQRRGVVDAAAQGDRVSVDLGPLGSTETTVGEAR